MIQPCKVRILRSDSRQLQKAVQPGVADGRPQRIGGKEGVRLHVDGFEGGIGA